MAEYESGGDPSKAQVGDDPNHKMFMAWKVDDEDGSPEYTVHYHHGRMGFGTSAHNYMMHINDNFVGTMGLDEKGRIQHIETHPEMRRQGLATKLYKFATEIHGDIPSIPAPVHSGTRTPEGDKWARAVGGDWESQDSHIIPTSQYRHSRWDPIAPPTVPKLKEHVNEFVAKSHAAGLDDEVTAHVMRLHDKIKFNLDQAEHHEAGSDEQAHYLSEAHGHIDEMGEHVNDITHGELEHEHERLQQHVSSLY
jgi:GNAT superfamily N-acetyltransferase